MLHSHPYISFALVYIRSLIAQISWTSSAAELSNRNRFRNFYRTVPSVEFHSSGVAALLDFYGWGQVAILTEVQSLFVNVSVCFNELCTGTTVY